MTTTTKPTDGGVTLESLHQMRAQRVADSRSTYTRLLAVASTNTPLSKAQATELDEAISCLGITIDQMASDIRAVKARADAQAQLLNSDADAKLAEEQARLMREREELEREYKSKLKALQVAGHTTNLKRTTGATDHRKAVEQIAAIERNHPRAFGVWLETPKAAPQAQLQSAI